MTAAVSLEDIRRARCTLVFHARMGLGGYMYEYRCKDFPEVTLTRCRQRAGEDETRVWRVGDHACSDLSAVVEALNRRATLRGGLAGATTPAEAAA